MTDAEVLEKLVALQNVDTRIQGLEGKIADLESGITAAKEKAAALKAEFEEKKNSLDASRKKMSQIDLDIKAKEAEIKKKEDQMSQVKTNEAFKALQTEMDMYRADISRFEDSKLEAMEAEDEAHKWIKVQEGVLKKEQAEIGEGIKKSEEQIGVIRGEIKAIAADREAAAAAVDKNWYSRYERIRVNKGGMAIARLLTDSKGNGTCEGCRMSVRPQAVIEVKKKKEIHTCDNCARMWYVEEKQEAPK